MKLKEFIRQLQDHDQEAEVVFEGKIYWFPRMENEASTLRYDELESIGRSPGNLITSEVVISFWSEKSI